MCYYKLRPGIFIYYGDHRSELTYGKNTLGRGHYRNKGITLKYKAKTSIMNSLEFRDDAVRAPELHECISMPLPLGFCMPVPPKPLRKVMTK